MSKAYQEVGLWANLVAALDHRIAACSALPFQVVPSNHELVDPLSGRRVLLSPGRAGRPRTAGRSAVGSGGPYREGRTPPTLFYAAAAGPDAGVWLARDSSPAGSPRDSGPPAPATFLVVERERETLEAIERNGAGDLSAWESVDVLAALERRDRGDARVPLVFPAEPWLARTFFNLAPISADAGSGANGFVIAVHPDYEDRDLGCLLDTASGPEGPPSSGTPQAPSAPSSISPPPSAPSPILPSAVFEAVVWSWALLQRWSDHRGLLSVPFINGGKSLASGQSLACFHAQFYALAADPPPPMHDRLRRSAAYEGCPLCALVDAGGFEVARAGSVGVFAHPAPEIELTLLVASLDHMSGLTELRDPTDLARALVLAVRSYEHLLGGVPPYNVIVRAGLGVDHLHAEVMPRAGVGVAAGFEKATGFFVSTRAPRVVAAELRAWFEGRGPAL